MKQATGIHQCLLAAAAFATVLAAPASAQSADLGGDWLMTDKEGTVYRMEFTEEGNSWRAAARSKVLVDLKLNPAGLRNQWVGSLEYFGKHDVKAQLRGDEIKLTDLDDADSWVLKRPK